MNKFDEREKSFEKKFSKDQELQFKLTARSNKYLGEWASSTMGKNEEEKKNYIQEIIKADMEEAGSEDVFRKIKKDFETASISIEESEIRDPLILGEKTYHDISKDVARPVEGKANKYWWILFSLSLGLFLWRVSCMEYTIGTGIGFMAAVRCRTMALTLWMWPAGDYRWTTPSA